MAHDADIRAAPWVSGGADRSAASHHRPAMAHGPDRFAHAGVVRFTADSQRLASGSLAGLPVHTQESETQKSDDRRFGYGDGGIVQIRVYHLTNTGYAGKPDVGGRECEVLGINSQEGEQICVFLIRACTLEGKKSVTLIEHGPSSERATNQRGAVSNTGGGDAPDDLNGAASTEGSYTTV